MENQNHVRISVCKGKHRYRYLCFPLQTEIRTWFWFSTHLRRIYITTYSSKILKYVPETSQAGAESFQNISSWKINVLNLLFPGSYDSNVILYTNKYVLTELVSNESLHLCQLYTTGLVLHSLQTKISKLLKISIPLIKHTWAHTGQHGSYES